MATLISTLKISLISLTILSISILLKLYLPLVTEFLISGLPVFWLSLRSWLTPPYLYVVINFIIITIAASSRFQPKVDEEIETVIPEPVKIQPDFVVAPDYDEPVVLKIPVAVRPEFGFEVVMNNTLFATTAPEEYRQEEPIFETTAVEVYRQEEPIFETTAAEVYRQEEVVEMIGKEEELVEEAEEEFDISRSGEMPTRTESMEIPLEYSFSNEKPPVSVRFGRRKIAKGSPEAGKSLRVTKPKRQETFENTWKMITEGRSVPLARHLKKSDTWDTREQHNVGQQEQMKKSETFNERTNESSSLARSQGSGSGSGKLRKEPSLSQDDLNRRVEAFINKFNEEMRLQRMESLNRYKEMVSR